MNLNIVLLIVSYIVYLASPVVFIFFKDFDETLENQINAELRKTTLSSNKKSDISKVYIRKNFRLTRKLSTISLCLCITLGLGISFYLAYEQNKPLETLGLFVFLTLLNILFAQLTYFLASESLYSSELNCNIKLENLLTFYFNSEYPKVSDVFIPIYKQVSNTKELEKYKNYSENVKYGESDYICRFGKTLINFTILFEKAMKEESSIKLFNSEIISAENIDILSKLLVILEEPNLLKQLISEEGNEYAIEFNDTLENMVNSLKEKVNIIQEVGYTLTDYESSISKKDLEAKSKERLALLVKQNFNLIK